MSLHDLGSCSWRSAWSKRCMCSWGHCACCCTQGAGMPEFAPVPAARSCGLAKLWCGSPALLGTSSFQSESSFFHFVAGTKTMSELPEHVAKLSLTHGVPGPGRVLGRPGCCASLPSASPARGWQGRAHPCWALGSPWGCKNPFEVQV